MVCKVEDLDTLTADRCTPGTSAVKAKAKASSATSTASGMSPASAAAAAPGDEAGAPSSPPRERLHECGIESRAPTAPAEPVVQ